jgi:hypothetical protein
MQVSAVAETIQYALQVGNRQICWDLTGAIFTPRRRSFQVWLISTGVLRLFRNL